MKTTGIHLLTALGCVVWGFHAQAQPVEKAANTNASSAQEAEETAPAKPAPGAAAEKGANVSDALRKSPAENPLAPDEVLQGVRSAAEKVVKSFNAGNATEVSSMFLPDGEWIDEVGNVYQGRKSIEEVLTKYFAKYPGAEIALEVETVRVIGPLAIEEGVRTMSVGEDARAVIQYVAVLARTDNGWQYASVKDTERETVPTAQAALEPLGWLVGDWVNEVDGAVVKIHYDWSEDQNFLLGDYEIESEGDVVMKTTHRIGWDPLHQNIRSWLFDSDGGIGEGSWIPFGETWHIESHAILPDGRTGSATVTLAPEGVDRFTMRGTNRFIGGLKEDDFELKVVRRAPHAGSTSQSQPPKAEDVPSKPEPTAPQPGQ